MVQPPESIPDEVQSITLPRQCMGVSRDYLDSIELGKITRQSWWWTYVFRYEGKVYEITYYNNPEYDAVVTSARCYEPALNEEGQEESVE